MEKKRAVGFDALPIAAAQEPGHRLIADLAHQVPEGDTDAADGMLHGPAAPLPEQTLPELLADSGRFVGPLADQEWTQQLDGGVDQSLARHGTADAAEPLIRDDLDNRVDVLLRLEVIHPAAFDRAAGEACDPYIDNLHVSPISP